MASLEDGGPAATAGILVGDTVVAVDGVVVTGPDSLRHALNSRPGKTVKVTLLRGGQKLEVELALGSRS